MFSKKIQSSLNKRYRSERVFKFSGLLAIAIAVAFLLILFSAIVYRGFPGFITHEIALQIDLSSEKNIDEI